MYAEAPEGIPEKEEHEPRILARTHAQIIGSKICSRRTAYKNYTQKHVAYVAKMNTEEFRKVENGEREPTDAELIRIANALACAVDDLLPRR